jgi:hypothetical protein
MACLLAEIIPDDDDTEALLATNLWKVNYGYVPICFLGVSLLSLFTFVRNDSIGFLIVKNNQAQARAAIMQVYKHARTEQQADLYIDYLRTKLGSDSSSLTLKDAVANPKYRKATWINIGYIIFHELTGINVIMLYSN